MQYKYQNYTVAYKSSYLKIGIIRKIYCIESFKHVIESLDRFFLICRLTNEFELVKLEKIISKCVLLINQNDYFISICYDEIHD